MMNFGNRLGLRRLPGRSSPRRWAAPPGRCWRACRSGSSRSTSSSSAAGRSRCRARCSGGGAWKTCTSTACSSGCGGTCCCSSSSWPSSWRCWRWPGRGSRGRTGQGQRFVLVIDNSASMSATDVAPSRLAKAKEEAKKVVSDDGRRRPGDGDRVRRPAPGRLELHGRPPAAPAPDRRDRADRRRRPRSARRSRWPPGWPIRRSRSARGSSPRRSSRPSCSSTPTAASPTSRASAWATSSPRSS